MRRWVTGLLLAVALIPATTASSESRVWDPAGGGSHRLVYDQSFDGRGIASTGLRTCYWWSTDGCTNLGTGELQWYLREQVSVADGVATISAERAPISTELGDFEYRSGILTTGRSIYVLEDQEPVFAFTYGRVEGRMRVTAGDGLWPALWLLPASHEELPEVDIMELAGGDTDRLLTYVHAEVDGERVRDGGGHRLGEDLAGAWHDFGLEWRPDALIWYLDGQEVQRITDPAFIPHEPMYLLVNQAVGGVLPGPPTDSTPSPATLEVDHLRVWQPHGHYVRSEGS